MVIRLKTFEALEKYSECLFKVIDMIFEDITHKNLNPSESKIFRDKDESRNEPEINEENQFQMLHLFALFGLNDRKQKLTQFIQTNITAKNMFNYLL